ncbi:DNA/RNA non-specific endonuclease [Nitratireductor sp. XY-223]|uniref:DNA/RNA non-specific endonuclease n=1 Tax=Nitratireductor sp. XY-223 TaxID=2561926 RepID=UPI00145B1464|nr:DNA/RNA non-specific endonuclease [Nitratireductor sp. XY-223]
MARRKSLSWGATPEEIEDAKKAERESDFYSNIAPQERRMHVAWGNVEDWMLELSESTSTERRACVFQGPVFTEEDPEVTITDGYDPIKVPAGYWKIMAIRRGSKLRAAGFLIWQSDYANPDPLKFSPVLEQVRLTTIEVLSGLSFPTLRNSDAIIYAIEEGRLAEITTMARREPTDFLGRMRDTAMISIPNWTKSVFTSPQKPRPTAINGPQDIII